MKLNLDSQKGKPLRLCSYNIHKGFSSRARYILDDIRHAIRLVDADMLFLQEVVGQNDRKQRRVRDWCSDPQFEYLADSVWNHYAYGQNATYDHGHHGNAILSKYPLSDCHNLDLSLLPFSQRGAQYAKLLDGLHVFSVHMGLLGRERKVQLRRLIKHIQQQIPAAEPIIIAGDFNDWRNLAGPLLKQELDLDDVFAEHKGFTRASFPSWKPLLSLDRIYYRGLTLVDAEIMSGQPWKKMSDHCALYAQFEL